MHAGKKVKSTEEQRRIKRIQDASKIEKYNGLIQQAKSERASGSAFSDKTLNLTTTILDWNPENYTTWNFRREILGQLFEQKHDSEIRKNLIDDDLRFLESCLRRFPKVYWIWNHRRWCLETHPTPDWKRELGLVSKMLELDPRNFHGWHYRRYVVKNLEQSLGKSMLESEFEYTTKKINANFSNFSAWHHRAKLLPPLLVERGMTDEERKSFMRKELEYIKQAIYTDPDDQSSWIYHRWLITDKEIAPWTEGELAEIIRAEISSIQELYEVEPQSKWCALSLIFYKQLIGEEKAEEMASELEKLKANDSLRIHRYEYLEKQGMA